MNVDYVRQMAQTGDVLLVKGTSAEQHAIQITCPPFCHVAQLLRLPSGGLMVAEMLEPHGYQTMLFDDWLSGRLSDGDMIYFGQAPDVVRRGGQAIIDRQSHYLDPTLRKYDFAALPLVWLSRITGKEYPVNGEVCSLLVGDNWEAAGYPIHGNPSPGSFLEMCDSISYLRP